MIIGKYPCCGGPLGIPMPDRTPAYILEPCPHCGAKVWHRASRVECVSWVEEDFLAEHIVDNKSRTILAKAGTKAELFDRLNSVGAAILEARAKASKVGPLHSLWDVISEAEAWVGGKQTLLQWDAKSLNEALRR